MPDGVDSVNYEANVQVKINSGEKSQAAALAFRFTDTKQYFVLLLMLQIKHSHYVELSQEKLLCLVDKQAMLLLINGIHYCSVSAQE